LELLVFVLTLTFGMTDGKLPLFQTFIEEKSAKYFHLFPALQKT